MTTHSEHEEKNVVSDSHKSSDSKAAGDNTSSSKANLIRLKLKRIISYAILGFAPVVAVLALIIAVIAVTGNQPRQTSQPQLSKAVAEIDGMNASLAASKDELEKLKAAMAHEKTVQEERMTIIIRNITELQVIMHISPTLDEELHQPAKAPAPTSSVTGAASSPATEAVTKVTDKKPNTRAQDLKEALEKFNKK